MFREIFSVPGAVLFVCQRLKQLVIIAARMNHNSKPPDGMNPEKWAELLDLWKDAPSLSEIGYDNLRVLLMNLSCACPFGGNPEECCMHEIRKIAPKDRFEWVNRLSDSQLEVICSTHRQCSRCQMESKNKNANPAA